MFKWFLERVWLQQEPLAPIAGVRDRRRVGDRSDCHVGVTLTRLRILAYATP